MHHLTATMHGRPHFQVLAMEQARLAEEERQREIERVKREELERLAAEKAAHLKSLQEQWRLEAQMVAPDEGEKKVRAAAAACFMRCLCLPG